MAFSSDCNAGGAESGSIVYPDVTVRTVDWGLKSRRDIDSWMVKREYSVTGGPSFQITTVISGRSTEFGEDFTSDVVNAANTDVYYAVRGFLRPFRRESASSSDTGRVQRSEDDPVLESMGGWSADECQEERDAVLEECELADDYMLELFDQRRLQSLYGESLGESYEPLFNGQCDQFISFD